MLDELVHKPVRKKAVYDRMLNEIRQAIRSGQLPPRSRILSEPELCERYCISRVSVRTALAKLEKDGLIVKKNGLGSFVCDPADPAFSPAQELNDVAINLTEMNFNVSWYYTKIYQAAAATAPQCRVKLSLVSEISAALLKPNHWKGLLALNTDENAELEAIARQGIEVILFNRISHHPDLASVYVDYYEESLRAVRSLRERGCRKIALITPNDGTSSSVARIGGYLKAVDRSFPEPELFCSLVQERPDAEYTAVITEYLKSHRPDAVYIPFGAHFLPFAAAAHQLNIRIPEDMAVISFDDIGEMRNFCGFPFGYVKMPLAQMAEDAIRYLSEKIIRRNAVPVLKRRYPATLEFSN